MKKCRTVQTEKASLELIWDTGPAQVDFGEANFYESGKPCRKQYLAVSFPYSNDGYSQVFGGETAECVCQGLPDIFEFIDGVPPLLIFDNATGVGRRGGDAIHESELFSRYESKSLIRTTNLEFSKWGGIFTDDQMAAAMIDRLVHHGHLLIFEGKSYRMEHALMRRDV